MKKILIFALSLMLLTTVKSLAVTKVGGKIGKDTTWFLKNSPYLVTKSILIKPDTKLTIEPGVVVKFAANEKEKINMSVEGSLIASGTKDKIIQFTSDDVVKAKQWGGIIFNNAKESIIEYTKLEGATNAIACFYSSPKISNNEMSLNEVGIICENYSSPEITYNNITDNGIQTSSSPAGISCTIYSSPIILGNNIDKNIGHGITSAVYSSPRIENNKVTHNKGHGILVLTLSEPSIINNEVAFNGSSCGITCYQSSPIIMGNSVHHNNEHGISVAMGGAPLIINNDLSNNGAGIAIVSSSPKIFFNTIRENNESITVWYVSNPVINYNHLESNINYIMKLERASGIINAENNWWGRSSAEDIEKNILNNESSAKINIQPISKDKITLNEYASIDKTIFMEKRETAVSTKYPWQILDNKLLFSSYRDGNWEVYLTNQDGSTLTNLTNHPSSDEWPSWSPDGKKVIFTSKREGSNNVEIYALDLEIKNSAKKITSDSINKEYPTWSPDGNKIAFRDEYNNLFIIQNNGQARVGITSTEMVLKEYPGYHAALNIWLPVK